MNMLARQMTCSVSHLRLWRSFHDAALQLLVSTCMAMKTIHAVSVNTKLLVGIHYMTWPNGPYVR